MQKFIQRMVLMSLLIMPWATWSQDLILSCDFENSANDASWTLVNGEEVNAWSFGSAAHCGIGNRALYISNDGGTTYSYSESSATDAFVYQEVNLTAGMYEYTFDWLSVGEGSTDCFRILLVPSSVSLTAGNIPAGLSGTTTPDSWIAMDGGAKLTSRDSVWDNYQGYINVSTAGDYKLVLYWTNDGTDKQGAPAAIDNLTFSNLTCMPASDVAITSLGSDNVTLMWQDNGATPSWSVEYGVSGFTVGEGIVYTTQTPDITLSGLLANTHYDAYIRALCDDNSSSILVKYTFLTGCGEIELPYVANFDGDSVGGFPKCWFGDEDKIVVEQNGASINKELKIERSGVLISPYIPIQGHLLSTSFVLKREGAQSGTIEVGFVTSLSEVDNMTPIAVINPDHNDYFDYDVDFSNIDVTSEGYIVWRQVTTSPNYYYWIDSIRIKMSNNCHRPALMTAHHITHYSAELSWTFDENLSDYQVSYGVVATPEDPNAHLLNVQDTTVAINGLSGSTYYRAWVRSVCSDGSYSDWRACAPFQTNPTCAPIVSLSASTISSNGIALTWEYNSEVGTPATGAEILWHELGTSNNTVVATDQNSYFIHNLQPSTTYEVAVKTHCSSETSMALTKTFTTAPCGHVVSRGGNNSTTYIPMAGLYGYSYTQMLYPAEDLAGLESIQGISFRMMKGEQSRVVNIYLGNVSQSDLTPTAPIPLSQMTLVAENDTFNLAKGWCSIQFDTPFTYDGTSNLVVAIDDNTAMATATDNVFCHEGTSLYVKDDDVNFNPAAPPTMNKINKIADITFLSSCDPSGCASPLVAVNTVTTNSIQLMWAPGNNETSWQVEYKRAVDDEWTIASSNVVDTFYTINGLISGTQYLMRVGSHCDNDLYYTYSYAMTQCGSISVPYNEDFNSGEMNPCWTIGNTNGNGDMPEVSDMSGNLNFRDRDGGYVILPAFDADLYTLSIRFNMMAMFEESKLVIKIGDNPNDVTSFVAYDTISVTAIAQYEHKLCNLINYTGEGHYIMFHALGRQLYMDNLAIMVTPDCSTPINLATSDIMHDGAEITWECDNAMTQEWLIYWKQINESEYMMESLDGMSDPIHTIIGLIPNTQYKVLVANVCLNGDTMMSVQPLTFRTSCTDVLVPYLENFENEEVRVFPNCWRNTGFDTYMDNITYQNITTPTVVNSDETHGLVLSISKNTNAITSRVALPGDTILLNFDLRSEDYTSTGKLVVGFSISETDITDMYVVDTIVPTSNGWTNYELAFNAIETQDEGHIVFLNIDNLGVYNDSYNATYYSALHIDNVAIASNNGCGKVSNITFSNVTASSVDVSFTDAANVGNYTIGWATTNNVAAMGDNTMNVVSTSAQITGLQPLTEYYLWVKVDCSVDASGMWVPAGSFFTPCYASSLPYSENFDSYTTDVSTVDLAPGTYPNHTLPSCWIFQNMSTSPSEFPMAYLFRPAEGSYADSANCLYFRSAINTPIYAILPPFEQPLTSLMLSFTYRNEGIYDNNGILTMGVMTDINDTSSFIAIDTYTRTTNLTLVEHIFGLDEGLSANTTYYIAFRYMGSSARDKALGLDNIKVELAPSCLKPVSLELSDVTDNSASLTWRGTASAYNVQYRLVGADAWTDAPVATSASTTITGLTSLSTYEVRVQASCGDNEVSEWSNVLTFNTQCGAMAIPYTEDFNSYTEDIAPSSYAPESFPNHSMPTCWSFPVMKTNNPKIFLSNKPGYGFAGSNCLFFVSSSSDDAFAVMPRMSEPLNNLQVTFKYRNENASDYNGILSVGVMTNPVDTTTYIPLETYPIFGGLTLAEHVFSLDQELDPNTTYYIAFRYHGVSNNAYFSLDDIIVDYAPACPTPAMPTFESATATTATISWEGSADSYQLQYRSADVTTWRLEVVTANQFTFTDLSTNADYQARIRAICGTDTSSWSNILNFSTVCAPYDLPFSEDFSSLANMVPITESLSCWNIYTGLLNSDGTAELTPNTYIWDWSSTRQLNDGGKNMYIEIEDANVNGWLVTPEINISNATELSFLLGRREPYSGNDIWDDDDRFLVLATTNNGATWTTLQTWTGLDYQNIPQYTSPAQLVAIGLEQFADQTIRIAFYGESTVASEADHYIHIDNITVSSATLCHDPSQLSVSNITPISAEVSWQHGAHSFDVDYREQGTTEWTSVPLNITITSHNITGLQPGTTYEWRVRAICSDTDTSNWVSSTFTTEPYDCPKPTNLQANIAVNVVTLTWTDATHTEWEVKLVNGENEIIQNATSTTHTIDNLEAGVTYQAMVRAMCLEGVYSDWSNVVSFTTESCDPVQNIAISGITETSADISWTAGGSEGKWTLKYGEEGFENGEVYTRTVSATHYSLVNLNPGTTYDVYVRAVCQDDFYSTWSDVYQFTTKSGTSGIDGIDGKYTFNIYPNPTHGTTTISLRGIEGMVTISVVDMNGRTITNESIECGSDCEKRIDVAGLAQGTYFVRILGDNINSVRKLIVR